VVSGGDRSGGGERVQVVWVWWVWEVGRMGAGGGGGGRRPGSEGVRLRQTNSNNFPLCVKLGNIGTGAPKLSAMMSKLRLFW
jgi:hypothetical protein